MNLIINFHKCFSIIFEKMAVDYTQLCAILTAKKLMLDKWQLMGGSNKNQIAAFGEFKFQLCLFCLFGFLASIGLFFDSVVTGLSFTYTVIMMALAIVLFSRYTTVLLDTTENQLLFPKPIHGRTILAARIIHISYYMSLLTLSCSLATIVVVGYKHSILAAMLFLITLVLVLFFLIFVTQLFCLVALNNTDPKKIQAVIIFFLIFLAATFISAASVFITNFTDLINYENFKTTSISGDWMYFYPPSWMAGLMAVFLEEAEKNKIILAFLAVLVPLFGLFLSTCFLGKKFNKMLSKLDSVSNENRSSIKETHKPKRGRKFRFVNRSIVTKAVYDLVTQLMKTDQSFKFRTYPAIGMILAYIVSFIYNNYENSLDEVFSSGALLLFLYMATSIIATTVIFLQYGNQFQAGWIYQVLPLPKPGEILTATINAFIRRFMIPLNILIVGLCSVLWGLEGMVDALFAGIVSVLICIWQCRRMKFIFPFSQDFSSQTDGSKIFLDQFLILLPVLLFVAVHALLKFTVGYIGVALASGLVILITFIFYRKLGQLNWHDLKVDQYDHYSWNVDKHDNSR